MNLHLSENDKKTLFNILNKYFSDYDFYAFGSRVSGTHKKYSDLDLAVIDHKNKGLFPIKNDLEDSNLTITVDVVNYNSISQDFKDVIDKKNLCLNKLSN